MYCVPTREERERWLKLSKIAYAYGRKEIGLELLCAANHSDGVKIPTVYFDKLQTWCDNYFGTGKLPD